jgi:hypothetical protein
MPSRMKILGRAMMLVPVVLIVSLLVLNPSRLFHRAMFTPRPLTIIVRTPTNVRTADQIAPLVARFKANNVKAVWVQFKQDETDEFESGQAFYPSRVAPVAKGYETNVLGQFVDALSVAGIDVYAWVPTLHDGSAIRAHPTSC